ncbi:MAG: hypothetical protein GX605_08305, partial [Chloroflexi bacterium]|nr:hypothetical protein [Chloroflexota bacterium]
LGVGLDAAETIARAYRLGRDGQLLFDLLTQWEALQQGYTLEPTLTYNPGLTTAYLRGLAQQVDQPVQDAVLLIHDLQVTATASQVGRQLDVAATRDLLVQRLTAMDGGDVPLVVREVAPSSADVGLARRQVEMIIGADLRLNAPPEVGRGPWTLPRERLAELLHLQQAVGPDGPRWEAWLDPKALTEFVQGIADEVAQKPQDARFDYDPVANELVPLVASQNGYSLDVEAALAQIGQQVLTNQREVRLPVEVRKPRLSVENIPVYDIHELVVKGTTSFKGSSAARVKNIELAAAKFQGILLAPDEVFSFNEHLGPVTSEEGYADSLIIVGDRTDVGIGGGVCQVSTTAFRAAFWGGYEIVERWAHGYRVSWYEPPVGLDATIYSPLVDFRFRNDTPHYLFIETEVDKAAGVISFTFWGTKQGREVEMEDPIVANEQQPGPPVYRDDPSVPAGETRQVDWAQKGMDVTVKRTVREGDTVIRQDSFFSQYRPWQAVYLVGTGGAAQ